MKALVKFYVQIPIIVKIIILLCLIIIGPFVVGHTHIFTLLDINILNINNYTIIDYWVDGFITIVSVCTFLYFIICMFVIIKEALSFLKKKLFEIDDYLKSKYLN